MRRWTSLFWIALWAAGPSYARDEVIPLDSPPVFVQLAGAYAYRDIGATSSSTETRPGEQIQEWAADGRVTVPVAWGLGVRVQATGEGATSKFDTGARFELVGAGGEGQLFWRDPTKGQVGLGYGYYWLTSTTPSTVDSVRIQSLPVYASLYMPSMNGVAVDWNASFRYDFLSLQSAGGDKKEWAYEARASSIWYVNELISFEAGVRYERLIKDKQEDILEGAFALEILVPTGGDRFFGSVALIGGVGRSEKMDLAPPTTSLSSLAWRVGVQASVFFPGVHSLLELNRAYR
ncbi:MAG: hypothetical protein P8M78_12525 [Myxococcota bacterium]|nr:hypothetical protein [Myxococcota bacterium]